MDNKKLFGGQEGHLHYKNLEACCSVVMLLRVIPSALNATYCGCAGNLRGSSRASAPLTCQPQYKTKNLGVLL